PSQTIAKVVVEPAGEDLSDASPLKQPLVRLVITPEADARKKAVKVVVRTQATLMSRRLVPFLAGTKAPKVPPPDDEERKAALAGVFVCALRANDIPARQMVGRMVKSQTPIDKPPYGAHSRAEFFAEGVGWVPVDPTFGLGDKTPSGLTQFGNDAGDFLVLHLD